MAAKTSLRDYQRDLAGPLRTAGPARSASKLGPQVGDELCDGVWSEAATILVNLHLLRHADPHVLDSLVPQKARAL